MCRKTSTSELAVAAELDIKGYGEKGKYKGLLGSILINRHTDQVA